MNNYRRLIALAVIFTAGISLSAQVKVHVKDSEANGQIIPKEIYGQFSEHLGSCIYGGLWVGKDSPIPNKDGYRLDVLNALKELQVPVMRWPGGCFADDYHWMDGIGPVSERAKISNNNWGGTLEDNSFGTHEFLNLCELLDCEPYISGNVGSGTPEELAKWVEYMTSSSHSTVAEMRRENGRDEPWKVKFLGIGNEAWGCGGNMTPEYYSNLFRRYTTYTRDYNGNRLYKIASGASDTDYNWTEVCMQNIGDKMDAIAVHYYTCMTWTGSKGSATNFTDQEYYRALGRAVAIEPCIQKHIAIMDKYDPECKVDLLVDEWGTWWDVEPGTDPGHLFQQNTMRDAIVAAVSLDIFHKYTRRIKMANIAQVVNVLQSMILTRDDQMVLTPTYHVFEMYKVHQDAEFIPVDYSTSEIANSDKGPVPSLSATASRKGDVVNVDITNIDLKNDQEVLLTWDDLGKVRKRDVSARILTSKKITDCNEFGKKAKVAPEAFKDFKVTNDGIELKVPAMSIIAIEIK